MPIQLDDLFPSGIFKSRVVVLGGLTLEEPVLLSQGFEQHSRIEAKQLLIRLGTVRTASLRVQHVQWQADFRGYDFSRSRRKLPFTEDRLRSAVLNPFYRVNEVLR